MKSYFAFAAVFAAGALASLSCSKDSAEQAPPPKPVDVLAAMVARQSVPVQISTFGTVQANSTVTVKAQVTGILNVVHFKKGQDVKKDQLLFEIDSRPFVAALQQLQANKARDEATLDNANKELVRQTELRKKGITAQADFETAQTNAAAAEAAVKADQAGIDNAQLQVGYCTIRSPLDGRAGDTLVDAGNLVSANSTSLVTIDQIQPIEVYFGIVQNDLPAVQRYMKQSKLKVQATIPNTGEPAEEGELTFVDNYVDVTSGMIRLGATFKNEHERLWPGLYVDVDLTLTVEKDAIVVPSQAVQIGRDGQYVFVIVPNGKGQNIAEVRPVTASRSMDGITIIASGLKAGEQVVTDGQVRLLPGAKVQVRQGLLEASSAPASGPGKSTTSGKVPATEAASRGAEE